MIRLAAALLIAGLAAGVTGCATIDKVLPSPAETADKAWVGLAVSAETLDGLALSRVIHGRDATTAYNTLIVTVTAITASDDTRLMSQPPDPFNATVADHRAVALAAVTHAENDLLTAAQR